MTEIKVDSSGGIKIINKKLEWYMKVVRATYHAIYPVIAVARIIIVIILIIPLLGMKDFFTEIVTKTPELGGIILWVAAIIMILKMGFPGRIYDNDESGEEKQ